MLRSHGRSHGVSMTEYIIIVSLVAIACLIVVTMFGRQIANLFGRSTKALGTGKVAATPAVNPGGAVGIDFAGSGKTGEVVKGFDPGAVMTAAEKLQAAKDMLNLTPEGKALLKYLNDHGIPIVLQAGDGSTYNPTLGQINLNSDKSPTSLALTLIHEGNHARYHKEGIGANVMTDTRLDYVNKMIEEETVGTVASIELKNRLNQQGYNIVSTYPAEREYNAAYAKAVNDLKAANPAATAAELEAAGHQAGLDAVRKEFNDGVNIVTSNTHEKYRDYYGNSWDSNHP